MIGFGIFGLMAATGYWVSSNAGRFRGTDFMDLDPMVEEQKELPQGKFGQVTVYYVLDAYASGSDHISTWGIQMKSGESAYYMLVLPDYSVITAKVSDKSEISELEALSNQFWEYLNDENRDMSDLPDYILKGKVGRIQESRLKQYYEEHWNEMGVDQALVFKKSDIMIDATAIPGGQQALIIVLPIVILGAGVGLFFLLRRRRAKKAAATAQAVNQSLPEQADAWPQEEKIEFREEAPSPSEFGQAADSDSPRGCDLEEEKTETDVWKQSQSEGSYSRDGIDL
ncbi:MAG: hypothetical protein J6H18_03295 [Lachnospiraceae bacterium]|nr:hypothetical protein [Lachnospiraceae bacterium]